MKVSLPAEQYVSHIGAGSASWVYLLSVHFPPFIPDLLKIECPAMDLTLFGL